MANVISQAVDERAAGEGAASLPAERALLETVRRVMRRPVGWRALAVHVSRLPERRPYHGRIARALLEEAAPRVDGQIHALSNGDLLLFCRQDARALRGLVSALERLFPETLVSLWSLESEALSLIAYAAGRLTESVSAPSPPPLAGKAQGPGRLFDPAPAPADAPPLGALVRRESGVRLAQGRMTLGFRDWRVDPALLAASETGREEADPALLRYRLGGLDGDLLAALTAAAGTGLPLDPVPHRAGAPAWPGGAAPPPLHLHLSLAGVMAADFPRLAALCQESGVALAIIIAFEEACADPPMLEAARRVIAAAGALFGLGGIQAETFSCAAPAALGPDFLVLDFSPALAERSARDCARLFYPLGGDQVVLSGADGEAALAWGVGRGITLFQGRHVAAMAAAARMFACPSARHCTLGQCIARAAAAAPEGRFGCAEPAMLDGAGPPSDPGPPSDQHDGPAA
jgi:hypothetical protein